MVRGRISSPRDRVRLAAVCRPWHDAAWRLPAQLAVPALILSPYGRSKKKHMCGPCGSWVLRVPTKAVKTRFVGSHRGGWIAATDDHQLVIVNLFSGVEVQLTAKQKMIASIPTVKGPHNIKKVIFSQDPASSDGDGSILAAITHDGDSIAVCRLGCPNGGWSTHLWHGDSFWDIAFYDGELYALTMVPEKLVKVEIVIKQDKTLEIMATHPLSIQSRFWACYNAMYYDSYIVELHNELMIAVRERWSHGDKYFFRVFKLVDADNDKAHKHKWAQVTSFGEYALFLGWSKAVHVPVGGNHGVKRNHIYYYI
ncbi:hypothetical protein ZWY2020_015831 [Hordeum vulgare]|nr:hypothetical protein ZWY2020_015831 [Hordeum vulgare]